MSSAGDDDEQLTFEHVGTMVVDGPLVLCDVNYLAPHFAGTRRGPLALAAELPVAAGQWQVLVTRAATADADGDHPVHAVLLALDEELDSGPPIASAPTRAVIAFDSGRLAVLAAELRGEPILQTAVLEAPREQVPCMLRAPGPVAGPAAGPIAGVVGAEPRGTLIDIDRAGTLAIHAPPGADPPRCLLVAFAE